MQPPPSPDNHYDAIVIGSGIGGLATAALAARIHGWRVLVLERHYEVGGFTHTFKRPGGFEWDTGVHYVGQMNEGNSARKLFDYISEGRLGWRRMPETFDIFEYPDFTFSQTAGASNYADALVAKFPAEEQAIRTYLRDIKRASSWQGLRAVVRGKFSPLRWLVWLLTLRGRRLGRLLTSTYLQSRFESEQLRALLASIWLDYGLPPSQSSFATHALLVQHYMDGAYYPEGGAAEIAKSIRPTFEKTGGEVLLRREVNKILVENNRATGVEVTHAGKTERYYAPAVFSGVGAWNTYTRLLPETVAPGQTAELRAFHQPDLAPVTLYIGFHGDPRELGFTGANHWLAASYDHETHALGVGDVCNVRYGVLSFGTLKGGSAGPHTAEFIALASHADFAEWQDSGWKKRGDKYEALKERLTDGLLALVEKHHPGFRAMVKHAELSTPLSLEHFAASYQGMAYGIPATPEKLQLSMLEPRTPVRGLYLTGADALSFGVVGAAFGAVAAVGKQLGRFGFFRVMTKVARAAGTKGM